MDHPIITAPLLITATGVFVVEGTLQFIQVAMQLTCCTVTALQKNDVKLFYSGSGTLVNNDQGIDISRQMAISAAWSKWFVPTSCRHFQDAH